MENTKKNTPAFSRLTVNRIASAKGLLLFCALLSLFLDVAVMVMLFFNTSDIKFLVCPVLLLVIDILLLIKVIFSNYRFAYAIRGVWVHALSVLIVCAYMIVSSEILDGRIIFTTFALYAMPGVHLIQSLAALTSAFHAINKSKISRSVIAVLTTAVFTAGAVFYGYFIAQNGFFGQGSNRTERTLVYSYDESRGHYVVTDLLRGFGNTVIIPETFNGSPVGGIDCTIFADKMLSYVVFECNPDIAFLNAEKLGNANTDLKYETSKLKLDGLRTHLFSLTGENSLFFSVANGIVPNDLENGQIYVMFCYDRDTLATAGNTILPTWFGNANDVLNINAHAASIPYIEHSDSASGADLYWCTQNQGNMIFDALLDGNGTDINNTAVTQSAQVNVTFEKIYRINIGEDNDTVYSIDRTYTDINTVDGLMPYRLATADRVMTILNQLPQRNGFDRSFKIGSNKHDLTDINAELAILDEAGMLEIDVYPHWQLRAPVITEILADGKSENHSAIYGSNVKLTSEATSPHEEIALRYEWKKDGVIASVADYTINNLHPEDAGEYTLVVTAYADFTSLTATATGTVDVGFEKKELHYTWILPENKTYSASNKDFFANYLTEDVINGDKITQATDISFTLNGHTEHVMAVRNAGTYYITVSLTGDAATKYKIAPNHENRRFTVTPYIIPVQWDTVDHFEYDGNEKLPQASVLGLGNDGYLSLVLSGKQVNAGDHTAQAFLSNPNYTLTDTEKTYTITPKPITSVIWETNDSFVYTSEALCPKVEGFEGVIERDETDVMADLIYAGKQINAGNGYTATVQLGGSLASNNYVLQCNTERAFSITPKQMVLTVGNLNTPYTGTVIDHSKFSFTTNDTAKNDRIDQIVSLQYKTYLNGEETDAVHVVSDGYSIGGDHIPAEKYGNYDISIVMGTLTINPVKMTVSLHNAEKVYDGLPFNGEYTFEYSGLMEAYDTFDEVIRILSFADIPETDADIYTIQAQVNEGNEGAKYNNYKIEIKSANLTIRKAPLTVHAVGTTKTYDGYELATDAFGIWVEGNLYAGKTPADLGTVNYGGNAVAARSAGTYTLTVSLVANDVNRNYDISYESDTVIINPKPITITALDTSKIYNGQSGGSFDFEVDPSQLAYGDDKSSLGDISYGGTAPKAKDAGTYTITITSIGSNNYIIGQAIGGTFTIDRKSITVTPVANNKIYDGTTNGKFFITASGLVSGETESVLGNPLFYGSATTAKNAGLYVLEVRLEAEPKNYIVEEYLTGNFVISKAKVTVDVTTLSKIYDGHAVALNTIEYTVGGLFGNDTAQMLGTPQYSGSLVENHLGTVGSYMLTVTLPGNENYEENTSSFIYSITQKEISVSAVAVDRIYDGTAGGTFSISADGLVDGESIDVLGAPIFYGNAKTATNAGTYTLYVQFSGSTGNYKVVELKNTSFTIIPKDITVTAVADDKIYDGKAGGIFSITADGLVYGENVSVLGTPDFYGSAETAVNVGQYTLQVRFNGPTGNYNVIALYTDSFMITPKEITVTAVADNKVYDGKGGTFSIVADGLVYGEDKSVLGTPEFYGNALTAVNAGEYTLQVRFNGSTGNYSVIELQSTSFTIIPKDITVTAVADEKIYDGMAGGIFSITVDGLVDGEDKSVLGTPNFYGDAITAINAGKYTLQVRFDGSTGNYKVAAVNSAVFTITPKEISVTAVAVDRVYDGTAGGTFFITADGLLNGDDVSVLGTPYFYGDATTAINAGEYALYVQFSSSTGNYKATELNSGVFTITKKDITVTAVAVDKVYDGKVGTFSIIADGLVYGEDSSVLGTPEFYGDAYGAVNAGEYVLQVRFNEPTGNYNVVTCINTVFTITKKDITVTAVAVDKVYDGKPGGTFSITVDGLVDGEDKSVLGTPDFYGDALSAVNAGAYTLQALFNGPTGNYNVVTYINTVFTIAPKEVTVTAVAVDKIYDGTAGGTFSITVDGLVDGEDSSVLGTPEFYGDALSAVNAGAYTLQARFNEPTGNYNVVTYTDTVFTIAPKEVTVTAVAVDRAYSEGMVGGEFSFTAEGMIGTEESDFVAVFDGEAVNATEKGTYVLTVVLICQNPTSNYVFHYVDALFTIS